MIGDRKVLGLVPARGGSKGIPGKNLREVAGKPLLRWPVEALLGSRCVDHVIVSTDDAVIAEAAEHAGASVPFMRPAELASDTASSMDVVKHALEFVAAGGAKFDYVVMLEPTSPLTESSDIDEALRILDESRAKADSIVGVGRAQSIHPDYLVRIQASGLIAPYRVPDFRSLPRRQDVEPLYYFDGTLYISCIESFLERGSFYHDRTLAYVVPTWKVLEIDDLTDLVCVEAVLNHRDRLKQESG